MQTTRLYLLVLIFSISTSAQWYEKQNGLPTTCYANAIDAVDSSIATGIYSIKQNYIPDSIYITTNGGDLWYARALPSDLVAYDYLYDVCIEDENKIWFCTGKGKIYHTSDGGINWLLQFYDTSKTRFMNYLEMFDSLNGIAMGDAPASDQPALFLKTTNGGTNWISQNQLFFLGESNVSIWRTVDFVNPNTGYYVLSNGPLYKTTNGGVYWSSISYLNMRIIKASDANTLLGVDQYIIHRTTNGGLSWETYQSNVLSFGFDIEFVPSDPSKVWYACSSVCFSNDNGVTWVEEFNLNGYDFTDIAFVDENAGWLLARSTSLPYPAKIFRTTNAGYGGIVSVRDNNYEHKTMVYKLRQNYPNPFNPSTTIRYQVPEQSFVTIKVYDILGNEIATFVNKEQPDGEYEIEFDGTKLTTGIYFYQLVAGSFVETKKMLLIK